MNPTSPTTRAAALAGCIALLLASLVGIAVVDESDNSDDVATGGTTSTTVGGSAAPTSAAVPGEDATATTAAGPSSATPAPGAAGPGPSGAAGGSGGAPASADLGAPQDPGATTPPRPGTYRARRTMDGQAKETEITVVAAGTSGGTTNQKITFESEQGPIESDVHWEPGQVRVSRSRFSMGGTSAECDWEPDLVQYKLPLARGTSWTNDSSCTITVQGTAVQIRQTSTSKVVDVARVKVGSAVVDAWVIESSEKTETSGGFTSSTQSTGKEWFAPKHGLFVKQSARGTSKSAFGERSTSVEMELLDLNPR